MHQDVAVFQAPVGALPVTAGQRGLHYCAVQVEHLADLQEAYEALQATGIRLDHTTDHGMTSSMDCFAPDGTRIASGCNTQDAPAIGWALMGDVTRQTTALVLSELACLRRPSLEHEHATRPGVHPETTHTRTATPTAARILHAFTALHTPSARGVCQPPQEGEV